MTKRQEFPRSVKLAAWERCGGHCECDIHKHVKHKIIGRPIYDHYPIPASLDGPGTLENCRVLDPKCNHRITYTKDIPELSKSDRIYEKRIGVRKSRSPMRGWRKFDGTVVWRDKR